MNFGSPALRRRLRAFLAEDLGPGDLTTNALVDPARRGRAIIRAKARGVVAGLPLLTPLFRLVDPRVRVRPLIRDGEPVRRGTVVARVEGPLRALLSGERVVLNLLQHLSGIATLTRRYVDAVRGTRAKILDTRKTTPGLRDLEKYAVTVGGGVNHRMGLYDVVLVKNNHLAVVRPELLLSRLTALRRRLPRGGFVEIEARKVTEARAFALLDVDRILLDNMSIGDLRRAAVIVRRLRNGEVKLEASGNMTLKRARAAARTGVDFISVGALTHSAPALDLAMTIRPGA